ncbi:NAD(P)H-dependent flavin oxidoreductase [Bartonella sp. DGB2]|uniref:NAD(P)H-dependent flavin oxidoreductase n=1 Tax=Bartonella sp. DGB2 TaxID=3388426 RepID=UPI0039900A91
MIHTRITKMFGINYPIIAGGLQWLATPEYVASAAHAGIIGFLTAASFPDLTSLRTAIRRTRALCKDRPFGVNVSMLPKLIGDDAIPSILAVIIEESVNFVETSGRNPAPYLARLKEGGVLVIHKVPTLRHALRAQAEGVDAIALIGAEAGGHPGLELVGTIVQGALASRKITIPLVIGGGIGSGAQLAAALALGADGVLIGTRFLVCEEIQAHPAYKRRLIEADHTDTALIMQSVSNTLRILHNRLVPEILAIEKESPGDIKRLLPLISGKRGRLAYETGNTEEAVLSVGQAVAFCSQVEPLATIINRLGEEAESAITRLQSYSTSIPH